MELSSFILGVLASIIATWLFWKYQLQVLPVIVLCNDISVEQLASDEFIYVLKLINKGKNQVVDISINAYLTKLVIRGGVNVSRAIEKFNISNSATLTLAPPHNEERPWGLTCELTSGFKSECDIFAALEDSDTRIMVTVKASDALSGSIVVIQKTYTKHNLKHGEFKAHQSEVVLSALTRHSS